MTVGNLLAIPQTNIKRLLGYSSIAHAGYVLVGIAAMSVAGVAVLGQESVIYYIIAFAVSDLAAFIAIIAITNQIKSDNIADFAGMARRSPALAGALTLALLSLTGFPPTAGFLAKFYIFNSGVQANMLWLVVVAVLNTVISAYYYLRIIKVMWITSPPDTLPAPPSISLRTALALSSAGILAFGIVPAWVIQIAHYAAQSLT